MPSFVLESLKVHIWGLPAWIRELRLRVERKEERLYLDWKRRGEDQILILYELKMRFGLQNLVFVRQVRQDFSYKAHFHPKSDDIVNCHSIAWRSLKIRSCEWQKWNSFQHFFWILTQRFGKSDSLLWKSNCCFELYFVITNLILSDVLTIWVLPALVVVLCWPVHQKRLQQVEQISHFAHPPHPRVVWNVHAVRLWSWSGSLCGLSGPLTSGKS